MTLLMRYSGLTLGFGVLTLVFGCSKNIVNDRFDSLASADIKEAEKLTLASTPNIYVAGGDGGQAKYWKNGVATTLPGGTAANGIVVSGTNVYACGYGYDPTTHAIIAKLWKNGVVTNLSTGSQSLIATGIAISGTNVYVTGNSQFGGPNAIYWKNGVQTNLSGGQAVGVSASSNGDIYIVNGETAAPSYWKNGSLVALPSPNNNTYATAIAAKGTDVFVVGITSVSNNRMAVYWKNGIRQSLTIPDNTVAMAVAYNSAGQAIISGTHALSNTSAQHISYWNGVGDLNELSQGTYVSTSTGVAVDQGTNDIYVCGSEQGSASYWKITSGGARTRTQLSTTGIALAITVAP